MRAILLASVLIAGPVFAQSTPDAEELAGIRAELTVLNAQIEGLRAQLLSGATRQSTTNTGPALQRLDQLELELRRVTGDMEALRQHISKIVEDGTRRIADLEFRLVELEGGDISTLGETSTLGGTAPQVTVRSNSNATANAGPQLAVVEKEDFDAALTTLKEGNASAAAFGFDQFLTAYPGGPLSAAAQHYLGEAQFAQDKWAGAARSFLESFTSDPEGEHAPVSLYKVGLSLGKLGQLDEACLTFDETSRRYPGHETITNVRSAQETFRCGN